MDFAGQLFFDLFSGAEKTRNHMEGAGIFVLDGFHTYLLPLYVCPAKQMG